MVEQVKEYMLGDYPHAPPRSGDERVMIGERSRPESRGAMGIGQDITSIVSENQRTLGSLIRQLRQSSVIPYVGAGLSIPFGFDGWTDFLISASPPEIRAEMDSYIAAQRLEEAAERLREHLGHMEFQDRLEEKFGPEKLDGKFEELAEKGLDAAIPAALYVPALARGPVATTNLDRVLERTYDFHHARLDAVVWGGRSYYFKTAILERRPTLFKVHGDVFDQADRVLTKSEHDAHYRLEDNGTQANLHSLLKYLINTKSLLFLGCSLAGDRLMNLLQEGRLDPQIHYAIVQRPPEADFAARRRFLGDHCIRPIWYDSHEQVAPLLDYLILETSGEELLGKLRGAEQSHDWHGAIKIALNMQRQGAAYPPQRNAYLSKLHQLHAKSLTEAGDLTGAVNELRQASMATPSEPRLKSQFILLLILSKRFDEVEIELEEAERLGVEPREISRLKSIYQLRHGPQEDLAAHSKTLTELIEASQDARLKQVLPIVTALLEHKFADARVAARELKEIRPDDPVLAALEQVLNYTGKYSKKIARGLLFATWEMSALMQEIKDAPLYTVSDPVRFGQWLIDSWVLREEPEPKAIEASVIEVKAVLEPPGTAEPQTQD